MVDIISKSEFPRREDERARRLLGENRQVIEGLADRLTQGGYSRAKAAKAERAREPVPDGLLIHDSGAGRRVAEARPYVRISPNNRVVVADEDSGRQIHFLGEVRRIDGRRRFVLATAANKFFTPLDADVAARLADLDGQDVAGGAAERALAEAIAARLGYA